jgi:hypothetical protein
LIGEALEDEGAVIFKRALCRDLGIDSGITTTTDQLMAALDRLPKFSRQMYALQRSIKKIAIPAASGKDAHAIERAAAALYMRAALRAIDLAGAETLVDRNNGVALLPEKNEILIAILMAALKGEVRSLSLSDALHANAQSSAGRVKGDAFLDLDKLDELPFDPLMPHEAITNEAASQVDKSFTGLDAAGKRLSQSAIEEHVRGRVEQGREVFGKNFRFIVSHDHSQWLQSDANCVALHNTLGIPVTRIMSCDKEKVQAMLCVSPDVIKDLFMQFLELLNQAKRPSKQPAAAG